METKQTAVEWLFYKLWDTPKDKFNWYAILKQAEEIEKIENKHMEIAEEIIKIDHKYNNLSNEKKEDILNLLIKWSLDELKKLDKQQEDGEPKS